MGPVARRHHWLARRSGILVRRDVIWFVFPNQLANLLPVSYNLFNSKRHSVSIVSWPHKGCCRHGLSCRSNFRPCSSASHRFVLLSPPSSLPPKSSSPGVLADNSKSRFGRRRPYMIVGSLICTLAMLLLGFTRPFASIFSSSGSALVSLLLPLTPLLSNYTILLSHTNHRMTSSLFGSPFSPSSPSTSPLMPVCVLPAPPHL